MNKRWSQLKKRVRIDLFFLTLQSWSFPPSVLLVPSSLFISSAAVPLPLPLQRCQMAWDLSFGLFPCPEIRLCIVTLAIDSSWPQAATRPCPHQRMASFLASCSLCQYVFPGAWQTRQVRVNTRPRLSIRHQIRKRKQKAQDGFWRIPWILGLLDSCVSLENLANSTGFQEMFGDFQVLITNNILYDSKLSQVILKVPLRRFRKTKDRFLEWY